MTCIVAFHAGTAIVVGADSAGSSLAHDETYAFMQPKIFTNGAYVLGATASWRLGQILRYAELPEPPAEDLERFIMTDFVDAVRSALAAAEYKHNPKSVILVVTGGRSLAIGPEFQVLWTDRPYIAIGSGRRAAYGALRALEGIEMPGHERVARALTAAAEFTMTVSGPFIFHEVPAGGIAGRSAD